MKNLREKHPGLLASCHALEIPNGWYKLVDGLLSDIEAHCATTGQSAGISTLKSKFATLRVYMRPDDPAINQLVETAMAESRRTCEICGSSGTMVDINGSFIILCPDHEKTDREALHELLWQ